MEDINPKDYDWIVVSTSGGKDSQTILGMTKEMCDYEGVGDRCVAVYADMGEIVWSESRSNAEAQAKFFDVPFFVVSRMNLVSKGLYRPPNVQPLYVKGERYGDLLDQVDRRYRQLQARGDTGAPPWFSPASRFCTSDHKNGPISVFHTNLATQWKQKTGNKRPCRILDVQGMRAEESPATRGKLPVFKTRRKTKNLHVDTWLPIHGWTEEEVWDYIEYSEAPYHWAYDAGAPRGSSVEQKRFTGMPRLSCVFCCFAPRAALTLAAKFDSNQKLLNRYIKLEKKTGFTFKPGHTMADVKRDAKRGVRFDDMDQAWNM